MLRGALELALGKELTSRQPLPAISAEGYVYNPFLVRSWRNRSVICWVTVGSGS